MTALVGRLPFYSALLIVSSAPLYYAAVQLWVWPVYAAAMGISGALLHRGAGCPSTRGKPGLAGWLVVVFLCWTLLATLPVPASLMALASPYRARILHDAASLLGSTVPGWSALSYNPGASLAWWMFLLFLALFFTGLEIHLHNINRLVLLVKVLLSVAVLEALYGILQALIPETGVLWSYGHGLGTARGTFFNRNHFAGYLEMVFPLLMGYLLSRGDWGAGKDGTSPEISKGRWLEERFSPPFFLGVMAVLLLIAAIFSQSRTGILGLGVGFVAFSFFTARAFGRLPVGFWVALTAIIGLTMVYGFRIGFEAILDRFMRLGEQDEIVRLDLWRDTWAMIGKHPLGIGLATFVQVFPAFKVRTVSENLFEHAHNDWLQLLAEGGWPGFIVLIGAMGLFLRHRFQKLLHMRSRRDPTRFFIGVGAASGLLSILFHSIFDFNLQIPANSIHFIMLLAVLAACTAHGPPSEAHSAPGRTSARGGAAKLATASGR
jgi:O-antigen ligase